MPLLLRSAIIEKPKQWDGRILCLSFVLQSAAPNVGQSQKWLFRVPLRERERERRYGTEKDKTFVFPFFLERQTHLQSREYENYIFVRSFRSLCASSFRFSSKFFFFRGNNTRKCFTQSAWCRLFFCQLRLNRASHPLLYFVVIWPCVSLSSFDHERIGATNKRQHNDERQNTKSQ